MRNLIPFASGDLLRDPPRLETPLNSPGAKEEVDETTKTIMKGFRRSREGKDVAMNFDFRNMSVTLPTGKKILSGVTGTISAGRVTAIMVTTADTF